MNILLIEDTKSHSDFIMSILKENNHIVKLIADGKLAFDYLLKPDVNPDIVITDNFLPSKNGLEIIEYFKENNYNYAFVILTSGQSIDLAVKGMKVGALEYLSKSAEIQQELNIVIEKAYKTNQEIILRKKMEEELKISEQQLRELNATKDKFFSIIAHDLKSPFQSLLGFSNLLVNKFEKYDISKQKKFLGILNSDIKNTYKLLENLLQWSLSQSGNVDFKPEKLNLYLLVSETIDILYNFAEKKSISIINNIAEDMSVNVDKDMISVIFRNLISNAIKFTPKGGIIEIGCTIETYGRTSQQENNPSVIQIYVKDSGVGIAKEKQANIFNILDNISTKGTEQETGTGLGLMLCKDFIGKHGGKIWVESEVENGSRFIFTLPKQ